MKVDNVSLGIDLQNKKMTVYIEGQVEVPGVGNFDGTFTSEVDYNEKLADELRVLHNAR